MDKKDIKITMEWADEKGHTHDEILELVCRLVDAHLHDLPIKEVDESNN